MHSAAVRAQRERDRPNKYWGEHIVPPELANAPLSNLRNRGCCTKTYVYTVRPGWRFCASLMWV